MPLRETSIGRTQRESPEVVDGHVRRLEELAWELGKRMLRVRSPFFYDPKRFAPGKA